MLTALFDSIVAAAHMGGSAAADAASYCIGSLLWSAFFFMLGYLAATVVTAAQEHLGRRHRDHS